jgi:hypothetical protein
MCDKAGHWKLLISLDSKIWISPARSIRRFNLNQPAENSNLKWSSFREAGQGEAGLSWAGSAPFKAAGGAGHSFCSPQERFRHADQAFCEDMPAASLNAALQGGEADLDNNGASLNGQIL